MPALPFAVLTHRGKAQVLRHKDNVRQKEREQETERERKTMNVFWRLNLSNGHALPAASTTLSPMLPQRRDTKRKPREKTG